MPVATSVRPATPFPRHLLGIRGLQRAHLEAIFQTADGFLDVLNRPIKKVPALQGITVANVFFENSTRTRLAFELAEKRLSADVVNFSASGSSVAKGETLLDTVRNLLAMKVDVVVLRHPAPGAAHFLAKHIPATVINAGDGTHEHPTQALLDAYTLRRELSDLTGKKIAIVGDIKHSRVALSNVYALKLLGADVRLCGPPTLIPPQVEEALGVHVSHDFDATLRWADAVNMLRVQHERMHRAYFPDVRAYRNGYGLDAGRLARLGRPELLVLHPGPINRGVELSSDVADSPHARILEQVTHGVATRMAVLYLLVGPRN